MEISLKKAQKYEINTFKEYLDNLGLTKNDLIDKKILDLGAGLRMFAGYCIKNKINTNIYCVEPHPERSVPEQEEFLKKLWSDELRKKINSKTVKAFCSSLPFNDESFDLVTLHCFVPGMDPFSINPNKAEIIIMEKDINQSFDEICRVLKKGGEARMYPFYGKKIEPYALTWKQMIDKKLSQIDKNKFDIINEFIRFERLNNNPNNVEQEFTRLIITKL
jgi:ubiquinone/menaquinone biosynthesis C-methylase UbiE